MRGMEIIKPIWEDPLVQIYCGNALDILKQLPAESIDAVVTDPPYGLGFMGKGWDTFDKSQFGQAGLEGANDLKVKKNFNILPRYKTDNLYGFCLEWAKLSLNVLKPGGYLLSFGGTRTYHRMACAIEDAGFEIRDMINWVYGCLSEDTEILTISGWERYHKNIVDNPVLCYNVSRGSFEFHKPTRGFSYENKHTAYRIKSDKTDQIVSRNHRVLVEREGKLLFVLAEELAREQEASIPILESLSDLPDTIPNLYKGAGITKQNLLQRVYKASDRQTQTPNTETIRATKEDTNKMCCLREGSLETECLVEEGQDTDLLKTLQWDITRARVGKARLQGTGSVDTRKRNQLSGKDERGKQSSLERWNNLLQDTRQLCWGQVYSLPCGILGDGSERRLCYGTSLISSPAVGETAIQARSSPSQQSRPDRQQSKGDALCQQQGTQTLRSRTSYQTTLARIYQERYDSRVWCVEVPTGAFIARRNGKIFITGNSGFPKSLSVGKAIDKRAGAEREVTGKNPNKEGRRYDSSGGFGSATLTDDGENKGVYITTPATPEAKQWEGWGTALKPAHEPIVLARKPLSEKTVAENVLKYGTGAINIDDSRIAGETTPINKLEQWSGFGQKIKPKYTQEINKQGRFPANLIHDGSDEVLAEFAKAGERISGAKRALDHYELGRFKNQKGHWGLKRQLPCEGSTGSVARFFYCAKASRAERDAGLEDMPRRICGGMEARTDGSLDGKITYGINNHPTVKPLALMRYLIKLVTPPNGVILDPFMGSGSTLVAARQLGFKVIGVDISLEYCKLAVERVAKITLPLRLG